MDCYWKDEVGGRKTLVVFPDTPEAKRDFQRFTQVELEIRKIYYPDERLGIASLEIQQHAPIN